MKNKFIYIFITLLLFFFVSCSNGFVFSKSNGIEKMAKVSFLLEGENKSSSRTMKPVFSKNDFVKLELVAFKKYSEGNYSSSPIELFDEPLKTDETSDCYTKLCSDEFELLEGVYKFCLYAYTNSDGYIFRGITEQDIFADATNEVIFTLLPYGSQETPDVDKKDWGHLNLKFYIPDNIKRVTAGMFFGSDNFFNFGVPVIVGDDDENHIYSDIRVIKKEQRKNCSFFVANAIM